MIIKHIARNTFILSQRTSYLPLYRFFSNFSCHNINKMAQKAWLNIDSINPKIKMAQYAVRGEVVIKSLEIDKQLKTPNNNLPFKEIISCNIGNPQVLGQPPLTFFRQVLSLLMNPSMLKDEQLRAYFPPDVIARAEKYISTIPGGVGSYSHSKGIAVVREEVSQFISNRDHYPSDPEDIFLTNGASSSVSYLLQILIRDENDGIMIPIPQYPLYSATITLCGGQQIPYQLDEEKQWGLTVANLEKSLEEANKKGCNVRAIALINPGNPTGSCLNYQTIKDIIEFAHKNKLVILADEVLFDMGEQYQDQMLVSFHSVSKGFLGECGLRGGYMELTHFPIDVREQIYKVASISLCSNLIGQLMVGLMVNPPKKGDNSYQLYCQERDQILSSLKRRSQLVSQSLNQMEGVSCTIIEGSLYAFPCISLPEKLCSYAESIGKKPDLYYCLELLSSTGIVVVPGSGFGQKNGTWHFRTTILPSEDKMEDVMKRMSEFHHQFLAKFK